MVFCQNCGGELPAGARNCPNCGVVCSGNTAPQQRTMSQQNTQVQQSRLSWWGKIWSQPRMARKDYWILALLTLLLEGISAVTIVIPIFLFILDVVIISHRLHDTNRSAWNLLWLLLPLIGPIILLIYMFLAGTEGSNKYGDVPQRIF